MRLFLATDLPELNRWYAARGIAPFPPDGIPANGAIEPGVAAGFLFLADGAMGLLENYVTNPAASLRARSRAVDEITRILLEKARAQNVRRIVAFCASKGIARRALKLGLHPLGTMPLVGGNL